MKYFPYGPINLRRTASGDLDLSRKARKQIWCAAENEEEGLSDACGCYVFALARNGGGKPWYVGKAEHQPFRKECLARHKVELFNSVLLQFRAGVPQLYFYARATMKFEKFCKPTSRTYRDIDYLERMLLGKALIPTGK